MFKKKYIFFNYVQWWHHDTESVSLLLALCEENPLVTVDFPHKELVTWSYQLCCFLPCMPEQTVEQIVELLVIWADLMLMKHLL